MTVVKRVQYTGDNNENTLHEFMQKISIGCYSFYSYAFGEILAYVSDKLPTGAHALGDYPGGYWKNGKHFKWSKARIIRDQNTGVIGD